MSLLGGIESNLVWWNMIARLTFYSTGHRRYREGLRMSRDSMGLAGKKRDRRENVKERHDHHRDHKS
jgi:hypothetical protein